jgi:hypothetical protein
MIISIDVEKEFLKIHMFNKIPEQIKNRRFKYQYNKCYI